MVQEVLKRSDQEKPIPEGEGSSISLRHGTSESRHSVDSDFELPPPKPPVRSRLLHHLRRLALPLLLGQFLSALIAVTAITSTYLDIFKVSLPVAQNLTHYVLLALCFGVISWTRLLRHSHESIVHFLRTRAWKYAIAGTVDFHANWAIVAAYGLTNVTSVQLLDCLTIPTAMILSRVCLKTRYRWMHVVGVVVCLCGAMLMVLADYLASRDDVHEAKPTSSVLLGDFLVIAGAIGYGASNVLQEHLVRKHGMVDYLGFACLVSAIWATIYTCSLELNTITELIASNDKTNLGAALACLGGFAGAMTLMYSTLPVALSKTSSVLVNLSLLTADVYALLMGIYLFGNDFRPLYIGSFVAIMTGVCFFASRDPIFREMVEQPTKEDGV